MTPERDPVSPGVARNVTAQGEEAEALRRERDLLSAVLDTAGALVVVLDRRGRIVRFNRACERATGYSFEEVKGQTLWQLFLVPEEVPPVRAVFEQLRAGHFPNRHENHWLTKDGAHRLIAWSNTALLGPGDTVEYVIGTGIDITERKQAEAQMDATLEALRQARDELEARVAERTSELERANRMLEDEVVERTSAEEALRETEGHLRSLMESAQRYAIFRLAVDPTHPYGLRIVLASPSLKELLGLCELTDVSTWIANIHPDDLERTLRANTRSIETGTLFDEQYRVFKPDRGEWDWVHNRSIPVFDSTGRLTHFNGLMVDITEQKRAQKALQEAYRCLEQRVEERTRELSTLLEVSKNLASTLELEPLLGSILDELKSVVHCEGCTVYGLEGDKLVARAYRGRIPQERAMSLRWEADNPLDRPLLTGQKPVLVADTCADSAEAQAYRESLGELQETLFPHIRSWLGVPLIAKGQVIGNLTLHDSRPNFLTQAHAAFAMAFANQAAVAIENARLYEAEQSRREEAERRRRVAEGLRDILAILNSNRPLGEILDYIVTHAGHLLGSDATVLSRLDRQTQWLTIQASHGLSAEFVEQMAFQVGRVSIIGEAVLTRRPTTTSNLAERLAHPEIPAEAREMAARFATIYHTILAVPLLQKEEIYGALALYYRAARRFTEEEVNLAVTFADQAALAIENARLREQAEQAAAVQERGRLARALHDSVTQSLYSVTMYTEAAARLLPPGLEAAAEHLRDARDTAQEALREMRLMIYQLRPPVLEKGGLAVALQVRLDAVERRGGMRADLIVEGEDRLPPAVQVELHQIAQESLNNALKHAHARQVRVHLHFGDAVTRLEVQDDGVGFDPAAGQAGGGLGLPGMAERAQKIGARLKIESAPGRGTQVLVEVPIGGSE